MTNPVNIRPRYQAIIPKWRVAYLSFQMKDRLHHKAIIIKMLKNNLPVSVARFEWLIR
jgi:hypothetical protein